MNVNKLKRSIFIILLFGLFCVGTVNAQRFRVTLIGFQADRLTNEGAFETDGPGDEITLEARSGLFNASGPVTNPLDRIPTSVIEGRVTSAHECRPGCPEGGANWRLLASLPSGKNRFPIQLFEGDIGPGTAAVIIPTIWEMDGKSDGWNLLAHYNENVDAALRSSINSLVSQSMRRNMTNLGSIPEFLQAFLRDPWIAADNTRLSGGVAQSRPIGMSLPRNESYYNFSPRMLILTPFSATFASNAEFGSGPGIIPVRYADDNFLGGDYTLFLKIEQVRPNSACPTDLVSNFAGEMTIETNNTDWGSLFSSDLLRFTARFTECRTRVEITHFSPLQVDIPWGIWPNITAITQTRGGNGSFNRSANRISVPITLNLRHGMERNLVFGHLFGPSEVRVDLVTNFIPRATGNTVLAGLGRFNGGFLGGNTCNVRFTGRFTPEP